MRILPHKWSDRMLSKRTIRITLTDLYLGVICIFPVATTVENGGVVNKVLFAVLIALHLGMMCCKRLTKQTVLLLFLLVGNYALAVVNTTFPMENINLLFYFPFFLMYTYFICDNTDTVVDWFRSHKAYLYAVVLVWTLLVGISIFVPHCYYTKEGGNVYFGSFCQSVFRLGPAAVFIQVLALMLQMFFGKKGAVVFHLIPMYCYLMGSSRTYLVVGLCLFVIAWYLFCAQKTVFWCTIIPLMVAVVALVMVSAMGDKIAYTLDESHYGDFWFRITSSRSLLWEKDMTAYAEMPLLNQLIGCGLEFTIQVSGVWGHNDFIEVICSFGVLGLLQYLYSVKHLFRNSYKGRRIPFVIKLCVFMTWFFNAFFNMHYVYFCAMLCYPLLLVVIGSYFQKKQPQPKLEKMVA